jgi:hypothetical protein
MACLTMHARVLVQIEKTFRKADLFRECQLRGIAVDPSQTCEQLKSRLRATPSATDTGAGTGASLRTCAARDSRWITEIREVFPLRKSIATTSLGGSRGVYMALVPATALPAAALGPTGLQTVAELAAKHSGSTFQMRAG